MIPQRTDYFPALAVIGRAEQAARLRAAPDHARLVGAARRERPDARRTPGQRTVPHVILFEPLGLGRVGRCSNLLPPHSRRAMQFDAKVAMIKRSIMTAVSGVGQREGDIVAKEVDTPNIPFAVLANDPEQSLTC